MKKMKGEQRRSLTVPKKLQLEKLYAECPTASNYRIVEYARTEHISRDIVRSWFALRPLGRSDSCCLMCPTHFIGDKVVPQQSCKLEKKTIKKRRRAKKMRNRRVRVPVRYNSSTRDLTMQPVILVKKLELLCSCF